MKRYGKAVAALLLTVSMGVTSVPVTAYGDVQTKQETGQAEYEPGEAIILYETASSSLKGAKGTGELGDGIRIEETYEFADAEASSGIAAYGMSGESVKVSLVKSDVYTTEQLVAMLNKRADIRAAEPNYKLHALAAQEPYQKYQWSLDNAGQNAGTAGADINCDDVSAKEGTEQVIALVDTGVDYTHEDLKDRVWENPFSNYQLKGAHGYDFINMDDDPYDDNGHGSHCAGIMAAAANDTGIRGVVTDDGTRIMALKILDAEGSGNGMEAVGAYHYIYTAQQLGVNVVAVNNSWGGVSYEESVILETLMNMVGEKGAVSVCAAGNEYADNDEVKALPASFESPYIISVAATNEKDELAAFSNYGKTSVDIAAPGADILSAVSQNCFNPGIYENKDELCSYYQDYTDGSLVKTVSQDLQAGEIAYDFGEISDGTMTAELTKEAYFGEVGGQSLKWSITGAVAGQGYTLYLPYTAPASATPLYASTMIKAVDETCVQAGMTQRSAALVISDAPVLDDGTVGDAETIIGIQTVDAGNYWSHVSEQLMHSPKKAQKRVLQITLAADVPGDFSIYLDNTGISKENVKAEQFGKYDYYNGTSMATPHVTAAVAALAGAYPAENVKERIAHVLGSVRKAEGLSGKVASGGVLDLSKAENPNMVVTETYVDENKNLCLSGKYLLGAQVELNHKTVTPKLHTDEKIVLDVTGLNNTTAVVTVKKTEDELTVSHFLADGRSFDYYGTSNVNLNGENMQIVSDGELLYSIDPYGDVSVCMPDLKNEDGTLDWEEQGIGYGCELFGENTEQLINASVAPVSDVVSQNKKLWTVLRLDMSYASKTCLVYYDGYEGWKKAADVPAQFGALEGITLAGYNGALYLAGGFDIQTERCTDTVMKYNLSNGRWEEAAKLPEARAFSKAMQTGNTLVLTLGMNDTDNVPATLTFDGRTWKTSGAAMGAGLEASEYNYQKNGDKLSKRSYYTAQLGIIKGGLIYTGIRADGLGDTFTYDVASDSYKKTGYQISDMTGQSTAVCAAAVQDKFYLLTYQGTSGGAAGSLDDDYGDIDIPVETSGRIDLYSMPVASACIWAGDNYADGVTVEGGGFYLPGSIVELVAVPWEDYYIKSFRVNQVNVPRSTDGKYRYRFIAGSGADSYLAAAEAGAYVSGILMEESLTLAPGKSYQLNAEVMPLEADNPRLVYTSDNPKAVKVSTTGKLTVAKKAKLGTTVTIRVTAADRGTVYTVCKVRIKRTVPKKNETAAAGGLSYKVTKSSAKKGTVTCTGFAGKAKAKVTIPATVKINGYTFRVTGIAKNAFAKAKALKNVTIKGTAIKSFGKGAFSDKVTVKVPKKCKKQYAAGLKQSGFGGKVK